MPSFMFSKKDAAGDDSLMNTERRSEIGTPSILDTNDGVSNDCLGKYFELSRLKKIFKFALSCWTVQLFELITMLHEL